MSSSSESGAEQTAAAPLLTLAIPELRTGVWTRFGAGNVLGDKVTEGTLAALAESTRTAANSQGYAVGWAAGQRAAREAVRIEAEAAEQARLRSEAQRAADHRDAVQALETAAARLHDIVAETCSRIESQASELAWELTRELVGHEATSADGADVVRRVLALLPAEPVARIRLHPDDAACADALRTDGVVVVADNTLQRGDALVEADDHVLDLRLDTALARVREILLDGTGR